MILKKLEVPLFILFNSEFSKLDICINTKKQTPVNAYRSLLQNYRASFKKPFSFEFYEAPASSNSTSSNSPKR